MNYRMDDYTLYSMIDYNSSGFKCTEDQIKRLFIGAVHWNGDEISSDTVISEFLWASDKLKFL